MQPFTPRDALDLVLGELCDLAAASPVEPQARDLCFRRRAGRLRIAVVGEAKRGKSTLVNALLGREVLPTGVIPLTALATTLTHADTERVETEVLGARHETHPLDALADLVTETGNPHNRRGLTKVTVHLDAAILAGGLDLIDTPGTGSVHVHNTVAAEAALETMDAAVFVLSADPPVSLAELDLLERVQAASVAMFVLLNKADRLDLDEQAQAEAFTAQAVEHRLGRPVPIYRCSARTMLRTGHDPGLEFFLTDLHAYLARGRAGDLERSLARRAGQLAALLRDQDRLTVTAYALDAQGAAGRISAFRACLANLAGRCEDARDLARTQVGHLLADLNTAAHDVVATAGAQLGARLDAWLGSEGTALSPALLDQGGQDLVLAGATEAAEAWRRENAARLSVGIQRLTERLGEGFASDLAAVHEAARDLLGVELAVTGAEIALAADPRFHYAPPDPLGPAGVLAGAARTRLGPGARRRVEVSLRQSVGETVDRQVGRARASLQQRLTETLTGLLATVTDRYDQYRAGLESALSAAETLRSLGAEDAAARRADLESRDRRLTTVISQADEFGAVGRAPLVDAR